GRSDEGDRDAERPSLPRPQSRRRRGAPAGAARRRRAARRPRAASWDAGTPDENTAYYLAKLRDLSEKFRPFIEQDGLRPVVEEDEAASPAQESLDLDA
ncbi:MAG: hypothetical protein HY953_07760, partial [Candidatus Rokubacteria bacterium]|nr:hypothetical protein [Candidatus Rokubacteria bacterium]